MVWPELGEHLVSKNELLSSLPGASIVNLISGLTEFKWLKSVYLFFLTMLMVSSIYLFHQEIGMGHWEPMASSSKYSM